MDELSMIREYMLEWLIEMGSNFRGQLIIVKLGDDCFDSTAERGENLRFDQPPTSTGSDDKERK